MRDRFGWVIRNWYDIMRRRKRLTFLTAGYSQVALIFPFIVVSPIYFFGSLTLGGLMQIVSAFGQVQSALSFFVSAYTAIADWKAVLNRLSGFEASRMEPEVLALGADGYLEKQASLDEIRDGLRRVVAERAAAPASP